MMNNLLKILAALIAFSSYANAVTIFDFAAVTNLSPTTSAANFNGSANDIYGTTDVGNGTGWGSGITTNFNGAASVINTGDQNTLSGNSTTYFGPTVYAGINRDQYKGAGGLIHSNGNGFRIRVNNVTAADIAANGGDLNWKAVFMFDADGADQNNYVFGDSDVLVARVAAPNAMNGRSSFASYRAMVKANGEYYAGTLNTIDLSVLSGPNSTTFDITENAASATWTLMDNMESSNNRLQGTTNDAGEVISVNNLEVDGTTTVIGSQLTNVTQVGFLLETDSIEQTGGYNYGVRQFSAEATVVPESSSYALIAGMLALASVMLRRRQ